MIWTFNPPSSYYYQNTSKVLLLGAEPNGSVSGPSNRDMGTWIAEAHNNNFWNSGGRKFFRSQLLHSCIARNVLGETVDQIDWYGAGQNDSQNIADGIINRIRVGDLKATEGVSQTDTQSVLEWALGNKSLVRALFEPIPDIIVLQGVHVQKIIMDYYEILVPEVVVKNSIFIGLPHPSSRGGYPVAAFTNAEKQAKKINEIPTRWSSSRGWVPMTQRLSATNPPKLKTTSTKTYNNIYTQNLECLQCVADEMGVLLTGVHNKSWSSFCVVGDKKQKRRVYLYYSGDISINLCLSSTVNLPSPLNEQDVDDTFTDYTGASLIRKRFRPTTPGSLAWKALFKEILSAPYPGIICNHPTISKKS